MKTKSLHIDQGINSTKRYYKNLYTAAVRTLNFIKQTSTPNGTDRLQQNCGKF